MPEVKINHFSSQKQIVINGNEGAYRVVFINSQALRRFSALLEFALHAYAVWLFYLERSSSLLSARSCLSESKRKDQPPRQSFLLRNITGRN